MADDSLPSRRAGWSFWAFVGLMLVLMVLFVVLGIWQVERLGEKEHLIANVASRMNLAPEPLPPVGEWSAFDADAWNYRPVSVAGTFRAAETVLVFTSLADQRGKFSGPGYWVMTPLELAAGGTVFINRGFVPEASSEAFAAGGTVEPGLVSLEGIARATEEINSFTPAPDTSKRVEWVRNTERLASMAGPVAQPVAPIYIDLPDMGEGVLPQGGETVVSFPNNHLGYAITWFGFATLVPFLLFFWARRQRVTKPPKP
ncbi:MAG TPA: SURF1 family protein [Devosia sp.]|jgi:surfeit locus 1 family protein|uniref:SURF1 family protein n=1 Tax=Devosia sp. TaxID=1871048 RepID=UPI002DDD3B6B|nr:SURF1 family protein [Devosia sp.]HEV2517335.1 SURF1 family protein [Devosia sp.]